MSAESPRHVRSGGPLTVPSQPPSDRSIIDAVSGFINDVTLSSSSTVDPKDVIQWARFETADINEPTPEGDSDNEISPLLLILGYGSGVQVWLVPPSGEAQEVLSWRQGTVRVLRILPTPQHGDAFASKRPLIALCDSASPGPTFCSLSFISIRGGEQVKSIKFKNPILDVLANKRSVVVSFSERFAVFDAATLEDRMAITTCYPCPCPLGGSSPINPLALGDRWLAYADKKLNQSKRSSGGCEGEGVTSYTATVLHAAKSLSKGLRGLGESVAHSLAGGRSTSQSPSPPNADIQQPGVVTLLDIEGIEEEEGQDSEEPSDPMVAHFIAHSEAIIALKFDSSGMLLVTADRRGHDFHVFRINPHPCGPSLASVHHLYILHRGDTTAKVQDIAISSDSRWTAISTLRGTTHVFAISPYGGACGVRTHTVPRVVNRLSRFHRSAGLPIVPRAPSQRDPPTTTTSSPHSVGDGLSTGAWFPNPRLPPYPQPTTAGPLAQLRPTANLPTHTITRTSSGRQRLSSLSEDSNSVPLLARARFGLACGTASAVTAGGMGRGSPAPVTALYLVTASGTLLHLVLHPRAQANVPKEKICDESPIEVTVEPVSQWALQRPPAAPDLLAPLSPANPLLRHLHRAAAKCGDMHMSEEERWLSQVEIVTHAGPHRRLWMGPQFVFKTYNCNGSNSSLSEAETVEVEASASLGVARSNPVNMPGVRPIVPVLIDSGSASSVEHSPSDGFRRKSLLAEAGRAPSLCDVQLKEDLAEAMKEDHGWREEAPRASETARASETEDGVFALAVDPLGCVVRSPRAPPPPPRPDPDAHTSANDDEATFRPVVRAPAALPPPALLLRPLPLPRTTTIPVQPLQPRTPHSPPPEPQPLDTRRLIPAALHAWPDRPDLHAEDTPPPEREYEPPARLLESAADDLPTPDGPELRRDPPNRPLETTDVFPVRDAPRIDRRESSSRPRETVADDPPVRNVPRADRKRDPPARVLEKVADKFPAREVSRAERKRETPPRYLENAVEDLPARDVPRAERSPSRHLESAAPAREAPRASRERDPPSLPKSKPPDIQPARSRVDESPTGRSLPKSDVSFKVSEFISEVAVPRASGPTFPIDVPELPPTPVTPPMKERRESKSNVRSLRDEEIKTEDQAWDMLLNEPAKQTLNAVREPIVDKVVEEPKPKSKKNRKSKKAQEEAQAKADDDSFVEIHTIEEKPLPSSGELVSISTPFEDVESCNSYFTKTRKARVAKSLTPERLEEEKSVQLNYQDECKPIRSASVSISKVESKFDTDPWPQLTLVQKPVEVVKEKTKSNTLIVTQCEEREEELLRSKESPKSRKSKSLSPYFECRKSTEKIPDPEVKDVYVIDSTTEQFPEIQITRGTKLRKKSPQPIEIKPQDAITEQPVTIVEKPIKSWSSIAAWKGAKKPDEFDKRSEYEGDKVEKTNLDDIKLERMGKKNELRDFASISDKKESSKEVSLHEKLYELCKRRDIMVAECDAPSELNFVEEHHAVLHDLPPLEPLDFALDDFKLEVMRDSLLEVNDSKITSPICKINIDDILSSIKETTSKVIESSTFNLIDLEKVPAKKERGFSVIESHKITSQEIKLDDDLKSYDREAEMMEKSSDDDNTSPVVSTDSDKEDKKMGTTKIILPSALKKSTKSKNSRRKKK